MPLCYFGHYPNIVLHASKIRSLEPSILQSLALIYDQVDYRYQNSRHFACDYRGSSQNLWAGLQEGFFWLRVALMI